jgi:hypothetical protein
MFKLGPRVSDEYLDLFQAALMSDVNHSDSVATNVAAKEEVERCSR